MPKNRFFPTLWALTRPYWTSEKRRTGLLLLATVVGLSLLGVWLEVQFNTWNREFYNTFESKDQAEFFRQLGMFGILAVTMGVIVWRYLEEPEIRNIILVIGIWNLLNLVIASWLFWRTRPARLASSPLHRQ